MHDTEKKINASKYLVQLIEELAGHGVGFDTSEDFDELEQLCGKLDRGYPISEPFSPKYFDILPNDGVWIRGFDTNGKTISTQALRINDLGDKTLPEYWSKQLKRLHGGQPANTACPGAHKITGRVVYHGEAWLHKDYQGRDKNIGGLLFQLGLITALLKWTPDFVYGFMKDAIVRSGFPLRGGYRHCEPCGSHWIERPSVNPDDWLVWMSLQDIQYLSKPPRILKTEEIPQALSQKENEQA